MQSTSLSLNTHTHTTPRVRPSQEPTVSYPWPTAFIAYWPRALIASWPEALITTGPGAFIATQSSRPLWNPLSTEHGSGATAGLGATRG